MPDLYLFDDLLLCVRIIHKQSFFLQNLPASPPVVLKLSYSNLTGNSAGPRLRKFSLEAPDSGGGAISVWGGSARLIAEKINLLNNSAGVGGAILGKEKAVLQMVDFTMENNTGLLGGALSCTSASRLDISLGVFRNNAGKRGGAIYVTGPINYPKDMESLKEVKKRKVDGHAIAISNTNFTENGASLAGGAIFIFSNSLDCYECNIESNSVLHGPPVDTRAGGGIYIGANAVVLLRNSTVQTCRADIGAGLFVRNGIVKGSNLSMVGNHAMDAGGAIAAMFGPEFRIADQLLTECHGCSFEGNHAERVGKPHCLPSHHQGASVKSTLIWLWLFVMLQ